MLTRLVRPITRISQKGVIRKYHDDKPYKYATMDDILVPSGCWKDNYEKKQRKYNMQLAAGILTFVVTFTIAKTNGYLYMNWYPPVPKEEK